MHQGKAVYYIDYFSDGVRRKNMGYVRVREEIEGWNLQVQVMGMSQHDSFKCKVYWKDYESPILLGEVVLKSGSGNAEIFWKKEVRDYKAERRLLFYMSDSRHGECTVICSNNFPLAEAESAGAERGEESEQIKETNVEAGEKAEQNREDDGIKSVAAEIPDVPVKKKQHQASVEDKWNQLMEHYPVVHPFENQGPYIALTPNDLHILGLAYRTLEHNSFLVHGYYSYRHLILGKYATAGGDRFYLGVPGTFEEREQIMAGMFGFEGYEHSGGMGYYMCQVEL